MTNDKYYVAENSTCLQIRKTPEGAAKAQHSSLFLFRDPCGVTVYTPQSLDEYLKTTSKKVVMEV